MIREIKDPSLLEQFSVEPNEKFYIGNVYVNEYDDEDDNEYDFTVNWAYRIPDSVSIDDVVGKEDYYSDDYDGENILVDLVKVDKKTGLPIGRAIILEKE